MPLALDLVDPEPVLGPLVSLLLQQLLASLAALELSFPRVNDAVHLLDLCDKNSDVVGDLEREALELMTCHLQILLEGLHLAGERRAKLVQDVVMNLVVLVVDFGLNGAVADLEATEKDEILGCLERASTLSDLVQ
jgi:hypothetical protein